MSDKALRAAMAKSIQASLAAHGGAGVTSRSAEAAQYAQGVYSPLMQRYMQQQFMGGNALTNMLPRDPAAFISGQFNPSLPTLPQQIDPAFRNGRPLPRVNQFPVGYNLPTAPGQTKLIPFQILRSLADMYDIARLCIDRRKDLFSGLDWDIVPAEDALQGKGKSGRVNNSSDVNKSGATSVANNDRDETLRKTIKQFFKMPDRIRGLYLSDWIKMALEELMVIDALSVYEHPTLGGDLFALEIVAGDTIKPLIDERGTRPISPNPAYQQYLYGVPRSEFIALLFDAKDDPFVQDLQRGFAVDDENAGGEAYSADQLAYLVSDPRPWTMYGFSKIEKIVININIALKRQQWHQAYFDDGDIPAMLLHVPDTWNIDQIQKYEAYWHAKLAGDVGQKHRAHAVPGLEKAEQLKPPVHNMDFDHFLAVVTCAGLGVDPAEIGMASLLSSSIGSGADDFIADRRQQSSKTYITLFENYFNSVIERHFQSDAYVFKFEDMELQDQEVAEKIDNAAVRLGAMSLNEYRAKRGWQRVEVDQADEPNVYLTRDIVPLDLVGQQIGAPLDSSGDPNLGPNGKPVAGQPSGPGSSSPTPRAKGGSGSGGSATNAKASPTQGRNSATKIAEGIEELKQFERFISKGTRGRRFEPDVLPHSIIEKVYSSIDKGRDVKSVFEDIRKNQSLHAEDLLSEVAERLLELS